MPNRIIRDGILTSERVNTLSWEAEVFYRRLMSAVDDFGRFSAHPSLLRAALYPLKLETVRDANIERLLAAVEQARLVRVYDVSGKRYLELLDFRQQVRAKESKFPGPEDGCKPSAKHVRSRRSASAHLDVDGDGDVNNPPTPLPGEPDGFDKFWNAWPSHGRKVAKDQCRRKWETKGCQAVADKVAAAVEAMKASEAWQKDGGAFIPSPLVWLNQARWEAPTAEAVAVGPWQESRAGIEGKGEEFGIGRWDRSAWEEGRGGVDWPTYRARVLKAAGVCVSPVSLAAVSGAVKVCA